ncbi:PREDICTED: ubiquitin carboxyl-terminal hydrolase 17 [Lupinus angustifolius]|uniref:ubiquitin carboxyl-terminal hydrolase 17 n=1 Tax=Lupinus angustifolius TaxID=3871 RepID=UPI00092F8DCA|nr:PREDICTED: ubiquitin carboxyl-terminal hydrolase 17 [Lupinus angustifolius]
MLLTGILGFHSLFFNAFLLIAFVFIRYVWKNAQEKKEEHVQNAAMSATASVDLAQYYEFSEEVSVPVTSSGQHQCAVCYSPTTMRCSHCKAIRYCSGKCQIIHWRQGHKDECYPPISTMWLEEENPPHRVAVSETQFGFHEIKGTCAGLEDFNNSSLVAASKLFDDDCNSILAEDVCNYTAGDTSAASAHPVKAVSSPLVPVESKKSVKTEVKNSSASKRNKTKSSNNANETGLKSKFPKTMSEISYVMEPNLSSHEPRRKIAMVEKSVTGTCKGKIMPSLNSACTESADNVEEAPRSKFKEGPRSSSSGDQLSSTNKGDLVSFTNSSKSDNYHRLPAKVSDNQNLAQNVQSGFKTSVQKVVQHLRMSKESKSTENEISFPYELFMKLYCYDKVKLLPFGLINCGNSCYANAVLQCLAYTRPLTSYLFQGLHSKQCQKKGWCFICEFEHLIQKAKEGGSPLSPIRILSKIQKIGSHLGHGREEDSHDFFRCVIDTMQSICLKNAGKSSPLAEETTLVRYTFGGYLRSKIKCLRCTGKSERYERIMDLTVEIDGDIGTLEEALGQFTSPETLDIDNKYNCSRCKSSEKARKKLTILEAPNILTIVLKRFQPGNYKKLVQFPEVLNMSPYMSGTKDKSPLYSLYAVVVHLDTMAAAFSGHYVCYVKNMQGEWFKIDDSRVEPVELSTVLSERAYMLLYARQCPKPLGLVNSHAISSAGKLKRRSFEAVPAASKTRSHSVAAVADSPSLQPKQCRYPHWNAVNDSVNNGFAVYPEQWRFNYGGRNTLMYSSSESSSLFSSSDASSCGTASIKESASPADFSDYIFGESGPTWYSHCGT